MKKRIFHKILIPALVVMLMTPFCVSVVKADATNQQILDMLTSIRSQIVYILQTQRVGSTGNYDTIDYLQKIDTNTLELDTHLTEIMADMTSAWDQTDPLQTDNYFESILNYFKAYYEQLGYDTTHLYYIRGNTSSMVTALNDVSSTLDNIYNTVVTISNDIKKMITQLTSLNLPLFSHGAYKAFSNNNVNNIKNDDYGYYIQVTTSYSFSTYMRNDIDYVFVIESNASGIMLEAIDEDIDVEVLRTHRTYYNRVYFFLVHNNGSESAKSFKFNGYSSGFKLYPLFIGDSRFMPQELMSLAQDKYSDFYTQMFNNGTSESTNIVNNNNSLNDQLQTSITQYDQVENQFKQSFSTSMNQISKPDLSNIVSAAAWYTTQLTSLFNASGSFQIIYVLPLVLGIALFFIGRGAVAFRQSSNQETRWVETIKDENGFTTRHGTIRSETVKGKGRYK